MKLVHSARNSNPYKKSCYKLFKYAIWLSISLYFLSSFLITRHTATISTTTIISRSKPSRALMAENPHLDSSAHGKFNGMRIYVYDLPPQFNSDWLKSERCSHHLFVVEVAIYRALSSSEVRTFNPWQADLFFFPVYVSCSFSKVNGFPAIGHTRAIIASATQYLSSDLPFWNCS